MVVEVESAPGFIKKQNTAETELSVAKRGGLHLKENSNRISPPVKFELGTSATLV